MSNSHCFHFLSGCLFEKEETANVNSSVFFHSCNSVRAAHTCLAFSLMPTSHHECHTVILSRPKISDLVTRKVLSSCTIYFLSLMYGGAVMLFGWSNHWWALFVAYFVGLEAYGCLCLRLRVFFILKCFSVCVCVFQCVLDCFSCVFQYMHVHFLCVFQYVLANCGGGGWSLVARELESSPALLPCCLTAWCTCASSYLPVPLCL